MLSYDCGSYVVNFNTSPLGQIPEKIDYSRPKALRNLFAIWVMQGNRAYDYVRRSQQNGYMWFLGDVAPKDSTKEFVWPKDQQLVLELSDGRELAAAEIITNTTVTWGEGPAEMIRIYPGGATMPYSSFVTHVPGSSNNMIMVAFPLYKWNDKAKIRSMKVVRLAGEAKAERLED